MSSLKNFAPQCRISTKRAFNTKDIPTMDNASCVGGGSAKRIAKKSGEAAGWGSSGGVGCHECEGTNQNSL